MDSVTGTEYQGLDFREVEGSSEGEVGKDTEGRIGARRKGESLACRLGVGIRYGHAMTTTPRVTS